MIVLMAVPLMACGSNGQHSNGLIIILVSECLASSLRNPNINFIVLLTEEEGTLTFEAATHVFR